MFDTINRTCLILLIEQMYVSIILINSNIISNDVTINSVMMLLLIE